MNNTNKIYKLALSHEVINHALLLSNGFNENDIEELVSQKIIELTDDDQYRLSNIKSLMVYYKTNLDSTDYNEKLDILNMILRYFPYQASTLRNKAFVCIRLGNTKEAMNAYITYYINQHTLEPNDVLILLLLSKIAQAGVLSHELEGLVLSDISNGNPEEDKIREKILHKRYQEAFELIESNRDTSKPISFDDLFIRILLKRIINLYSKPGYYMTCISEERYEDAIYALNCKDNLSGYDTFIKHLLQLVVYRDKNDLCTIKEHEHTLWGAAYANDFEEALQLCGEYNKERQINNKDSIVYVLLKKIISLSKKQAEKDNSSDITDYYFDIDDKDNKYLCVYSVSNLINEGMTFKEALNSALLTETEKGFVTLIYAREAYRNNHISVGDYYINIFYNFYRDYENKSIYLDIVNNKYLLAKEETDLSRTLNMPKR